MRKGNMIISSSFDNIIKIWEIKSGSCLKSYGEKNALYIRITLSYDEKLIFKKLQKEIQILNLRR